MCFVSFFLCLLLLFRSFSFCCCRSVRFRCFISLHVSTCYLNLYIYKSIWPTLNDILTKLISVHTILIHSWFLSQALLLLLLLLQCIFSKKSINWINVFWLGRCKSLKTQQSDQLNYYLLDWKLAYLSLQWRSTWMNYSIDCIASDHN